MSLLVSIVLLGTAWVCSSGTPHWDSEGNAECMDGDSECTIHCNGEDDCKEVELHCHRTAAQICEITIEGRLSAVDATIYTHAATHTYITVSGEEGFLRGTVRGEESVGGQLHIFVEGGYGLKQATVYSPVGEGSKLSMRCGTHSCSEMHIYDDYTTDVLLQSMRTAIKGDSSYAFQRTTVSNLFENSTLGLVRDQGRYAGMNQDYRAPVNLSDPCRAKGTFEGLTYRGHNHGEWLLYGTGTESFAGARIWATSSGLAYSGDFDIHLIAGDISLSGRDSRQERDGHVPVKVFDGLVLQVISPSANVYAESLVVDGLLNSEIHSAQARSLTVWCEHNEACSNVRVVCPNSGGVDTCAVHCDLEHGHACDGLAISSKTDDCDSYVDCDFVQRDQAEIPAKSKDHISDICYATYTRQPTVAPAAPARSQGGGGYLGVWIGIAVALCCVLLIIVLCVINKRQKANRVSFDAKDNTHSIDNQASSYNAPRGPQSSEMEMAGARNDDDML